MEFKYLVGHNPTPINQLIRLRIDMIPQRGQYPRKANPVQHAEGEDRGPDGGGDVGADVFGFGGPPDQNYNEDIEGYVEGY